MWNLILQLHKGGSSTTVNNSYTPTAEEVEMTALNNDFVKYIMPNAKDLNDSAANLYFDSLADTQVDYQALLDAAQAASNKAQAGFENLTNGVIPTSYQQNMENAIQSGVQNTMGNALNSLANRGVLNSSVTNTAMNDISKNVSDTMAQGYMGNIEALSNLYGNQLGAAGTGIANAAAGQEAAFAPAGNAWNMSIGLGSTGTGALSAIAGKGSSSQTTTQSGGGGWLSGLMGLGTAALGNSSLWCFTADTKITMADGTEKNITDIKVGDEILANDGESDIIDTVSMVTAPIEAQTYIVECENGEVNTTLSQPLMAENGEFVEVELLKLGTMLKNVGKVKAITKDKINLVYDIKTENINRYYANGFVAYGAFDEELRGEQ